MDAYAGPRQHHASRGGIDEPHPALVRLGRARLEKTRQGDAGNAQGPGRDDAVDIEVHLFSTPR